MLKLFTCKFPGCTFSTKERSCIDRHHIIPRSMPGTSNKGYNLIDLCPSCHRKVYVPGVESGHHSILKSDSIIIEGKRKASTGEALLFHNVSDGKKYCYFYEDGDTWEM